MRSSTTTTTLRFGLFELNPDTGELRREGVLVRLQPQPFRLLLMLARSGGRIVTREEIRAELWSDGTSVDFEQAVNFAIKQVRDALGDAADQPMFVQTIPKRGYRFIAPVHSPGSSRTDTARRLGTDVSLHKALWANIAEMRLAEERRRRLLTWVTVALAVAVAAVVYLMLR